jgi:hypothetical protein
MQSSSNANRHLMRSFALTAAIIGAVLIAGTGIPAQAQAPALARCPPGKVALCNDGHFINGPFGHFHHCSHHQGVKQFCDSNSMANPSRR